MSDSPQQGGFVGWHADVGAGADAHRSDSGSAVIGVTAEAPDGKKPSDWRPYKPHNKLQYMRDLILGINDGLVSVFLLVVGMAAGGSGTRAILAGGITSTIAGAIAMSMGEYLATKSQNEVIAGDLALEKEHFKYHRELEIEQVHHVLSGMNMQGDLLKDVVKSIGESDDALMKFMKAFEFGYQEEVARVPLKAMAVMFSIFICGGIPSCIPFAFLADNKSKEGLGIASALVSVSLYAVGALKAYSTGTSMFKSGSINMLMGWVSAGVSYGIGAIYYASGGHGNVNT